MAWLGFAGTESPQWHGKVLWEKDKKRPKIYPCPCPEYSATMLNTVVVADRFFGGRLDLAEELMQELPGKYSALLQYARAEKDAEPLQMEFAETEAKRKAGEKAENR